VAKKKEANDAMMVIIVNEFTEHYQHPECFELISFQLRDYSYCLKQSHPLIVPTDNLSVGIVFDLDNNH
jgi:hypothetical protein